MNAATMVAITEWKSVVRRVVSCRRFVSMKWRAMALSVVLVGCGPKRVPQLPPDRVPESPTVPVVVVPVLPTRLTIPSVVSDVSYQLRSVTELERDSMGRKDTRRYSSQADVVVRTRRTPTGGIEATGRIWRYSITPSLSTTPVAVDSVRFDALLNNVLLRVVSQPPLANECDRPETGALSLVRDLLVRVPQSVAVGEQWRDSTIHIVCRSNIPMTVRTTSDYEVTDIAQRNDGVQVTVRRTSATRMSGKSASAWRPLEIVGIGTGTLTAAIAVSTGAVREVTSTSSLVLTVTDGSAPPGQRVQQVTQRVTFTATPEK